ncbi:MAG: DUF6728 family protein [Chitinophagaceae bacterium]
MLKKIWSYITFQKQPEFNNRTTDVSAAGDVIDGERQTNGNNSYLRMMHGINRISIFMFLIGMIIVIIKILK